MTNNRRAGIVSMALLIVVPLFGSAQSVPNKDHSLRAASVLLEQFETVFYSEVAFVARLGAYNQLSKNDAEALRIPFAYLRAAVDALGKNASVEMLARGQAILIGAKDFRGPKGFGRVRSQFCYVVVLKNRATYDFRKYFREQQVDTVAGTPVWRWTAVVGEFGELDPRPSSFFAAQVANAYLLISNDRKELQNTAEALTSADDYSKTLAGIREWKLVREQEYWGFRRYRHSGILDKNSAGMSFVTPGAEALILTVDWKKRIFALRFYCSPDGEGTIGNINKEALLPRIKWRMGVWQTTFPFVGGEEDTYERILFSLGLFGFGICV